MQIKSLLDTQDGDQSNWPSFLFYIYMADAFEENIRGVDNLIVSDMNKTGDGDIFPDSVGELVDVLTLDMSDDELRSLSDQWESDYNGYYPEIKPRQETNKKYYLGRQRQTGSNTSKTIASNIIFEAEETFIPQALSKNPEPVVWSDNTNEGKEASNSIKTMLQYHADELVLRRKLAIMVRHNSIYLIGALKHGWSTESNDIDTKIRQPKNFIFAKKSYIDEKARYIGPFLGEKIEISASDLIEKFPKFESAIALKVDGKLGTKVTYIEWWTDKYCFSRFGEIILDKHKNPFFNYDITEKGEDEYGEPTETVTPGQNHFASPMMPYTFLSVFSLQEQPYDETTLIEQNIANQDDINDQDLQVSRNLRASNNSLAVDGEAFDQETARQAAQAVEDGDPIRVPGGNVDRSIKRLPASPLPAGLLESIQIKKDTLRSVFGVQGLSATQEDNRDSVRGQIMQQNHDSTRIGGGIGDAIEQVADNVFNWWLQLYYVFYDEAHYGAVMGNGRAVEYIMLIRSDMNRHFVVSVAPNSMKPKDEVSEMNLAIDLATKGWLDPINLFKKLNDPNPMETARMVTLFRINPAQYLATFFPENINAILPPNPVDPLSQGVAGAQVPQADQSLSNIPQAPALSQVPLNQGVAQPQI